jgi:hypothetical protein
MTTEAEQEIERLARVHCNQNFRERRSVEKTLLDAEYESSEWTWSSKTARPEQGRLLQARRQGHDRPGQQRLRQQLWLPDDHLPGPRNLNRRSSPGSKRR